MWSQQPIQRNEGSVVQLGIRGAAWHQTQRLCCLVKKNQFQYFIWRWSLDQLVKEVGSLWMEKKKGKILTQFLEVFNLRWFGMGLSLDKKEGNAEIEKITLKRFWECLSVSTPSTQTTPTPALIEFRYWNGKSFPEPLQGVPCVLGAQLSPCMCRASFVGSEE